MAAAGLPRVYLDECVDRNLVVPLRARGFSVTHALLEGQRGLDDPEQLEYAVLRGWILLSHNKKHFQRCHQDWLQAGRLHHGILVVPHKGRSSLVELRIAMLLTWVQHHGSPLTGQLRLWHDLHELLLRGLSLPGFTPLEVQTALGRVP
jgi:hypothetical protein